MIKEYNKLVRDRIPEIIESKGSKVKYHVLSESKFKEALMNKLAEEFEELLRADTEEEIIEELADLFSVCFALADSIGRDKVFDKFTSKNIARGLFKKRYFLESVEDLA